MAGGYCWFCDSRCFVYRVAPAVPGRDVWHGMMATCKDGMDYDYMRTGYTADTAINPMVQEG